jgi:hypothetical protein
MVEVYPMSIRRTFASAFLGVAVSVLGGCSSQPEQPPSTRQEEKLTPERAKVALLEMMRTEPGIDLGWFAGDVPDKLSKMTIEADEDGWYVWSGAFRLNPAKAIYTLTVRPQPGARACVFEYEGSFVSKDGRWIATAPRLVRSVLQPGE